MLIATKIICEQAYKFSFPLLAQSIILNAFGNNNVKYEFCEFDLMTFTRFIFS